MAYRFSKKEIEDMKKDILFQCEKEEPNRHGLKTAWRLGCFLRIMWQCRRCSQRERERSYRKLVLYETLTVNDLPMWEGYGE